MNRFAWGPGLNWLPLAVRPAPAALKSGAKANGTAARPAHDVREPRSFR
jgi:hypothetical protein